MDISHIVLVVVTIIAAILGIIGIWVNLKIAGRQVAHHYHYYAAFRHQDQVAEIDGIVISPIRILHGHHYADFKEQMAQQMEADLGIPVTDKMVTIYSFSYLGESTL